MLIKQEIAEQMVKASPPLTVGAMTIAGVSLSDWVLTLTLIYTALQIILLVRDKIIRGDKYVRNHQKHPKRSSQEDGNEDEGDVG